MDESDLIFKPRGVVEDPTGRVAGFWVRRKRGREVFLLTRPVARQPLTRRVKKTITVEGRVFPDVWVEEIPLLNSVSHWGKYAR